MTGTDDLDTVVFAPRLEHAAWFIWDASLSLWALEAGVAGSGRVAPSARARLLQLSGHRHPIARAAARRACYRFGLLHDAAPGFTLETNGDGA